MSSFAAIAATLASITLQWNAPKDGSGFVAGYDIRYSTSIITSSNWASATQAGSPSVLAPGSKQTFVVAGLQPHVKYYFAVKSVDDNGNWSDLSSVVMRSTDLLPNVVNDLKVQ